VIRIWSPEITADSICGIVCDCWASATPASATAKQMARSNGTVAFIGAAAFVDMSLFMGITPSAKNGDKGTLERLQGPCTR
jgi:hypothetical protein